MVKPRILDLFCGIGGAGVGLHEAGFEVIGVDIRPQPNYPFEFYLADALEFPLGGYDAYWASPPCQRFVSRTPNTTRFTHPDLLSPTRERLLATNKPFIIENVIGAPLISPIMLCGTMFGLSLFRHRLFESNVVFLAPKHEKHKGKRMELGYPNITGSPQWDKGTLEDWQNSMGIHWTDVASEIAQAIPPAYSKFLGKQLIKYAGAAE